MQAEKVLASSGRSLAATVPLWPLRHGDDHAPTPSQPLRPGCRDRLTATAFARTIATSSQCAGAHRTDAFIGFRLGARGIEAAPATAHIGPAPFFAGREEGMATGTVKWFNDAKGYGFITPDDGGEDLFAHFSAIQMNGFKTLKEGQKVQFEVVQGPKGKQASNITAPA